MRNSRNSGGYLPADRASAIARQYVDWSGRRLDELLTRISSLGFSAAAARSFKVRSRCASCGDGCEDLPVFEESVPFCDDCLDRASPAGAYDLGGSG